MNDVSNYTRHVWSDMTVEDWRRQFQTLERSGLAVDVEGMAAEMAKRKATALDDGVIALVRAGVPIERIEVVHETYSKGDDHTTIHQRAYVRVRED